jgi:hypothetical protein
MCARKWFIAQDYHSKIKMCHFQNNLATVAKLCRGHENNSPFVRLRDIQRDVGCSAIYVRASAAIWPRLPIGVLAANREMGGGIGCSSYGRSCRGTWMPSAGSALRIELRVDSYRLLRNVCPARINCFPARAYPKSSRENWSTCGVRTLHPTLRIAREGRGTRWFGVGGGRDVYTRCWLVGEARAPRGEVTL